MKRHLGAFALALTLFMLIVAIATTMFAIPDTPVPWAFIGVLAAFPFLYRKVSDRRFVRWNDRYDVGITAIDSDHRRLLNLLNQLQVAVDYSTGRQFEREALNALVDYTKVHFSREELLMDQYNFPHAENHKRQHREMMDRVAKLVASYEMERQRSLEEATDFLKKWLVEHIGVADQKYAGFFRDRGVI